ALRDGMGGGDLLATEDGIVDGFALDGECKGLANVEIIEGLDQEVHRQVKGLQQRPVKILIRELLGLSKAVGRNTGTIKLAILVLLVGRIDVLDERKDDLLHEGLQVEIVGIGNEVDLLLMDVLR